MTRLGIGRRTRVGVLGSYGGLNLGDEAILTSVLSCLRTTCQPVDLVVFSRHPPHTMAHHDVAEVVIWEEVDRNQLRDAIERLDVLVLGGGGIIYNGEARRYLRLVRAAQDLGVPTFAFALGAGPLTDPVDRRVVADVLDHMDDITVRDEQSKHVLEDAGVSAPIEVTADPALLLTPEAFTWDMLASEGVPSGQRLVGMSVREPGGAAEHLEHDQYHHMLATAADFLVHRIDAHVVLVPMEPIDIRHSHAVLSHMASPARARVLHGSYGPRQVLGLMHHLDLVVGMRLHFLIFAAMNGVPLLPLPYAGKVSNFARSVGAPALAGVARCEVGRLLAELDRLWDERAERSEDIRRHVRLLAERAALSSERCFTLIDRIQRAEEQRADTFDEAIA
jgi:polysaccharide pyruvyl transferase CsaB